MSPKDSGFLQINCEVKKEIKLKKVEDLESLNHNKHFKWTAVSPRLFTWVKEL